MDATFLVRRMATVRRARRVRALVATTAQETVCQDVQPGDDGYQSIHKRNCCDSPYYVL